MKKIIVLFIAFISLTAVSCKKESNTEAAVPAVSTILNIEYRISSQSGNTTATYLFPGSNGVLEKKTESINRTYSTINFNAAGGQLFSVEANNTIPSHQPVQVQLYVNGVLKAEDVTTSPAMNALAEGNF
jgi:hypothetical protein